MKSMVEALAIASLAFALGVNAQVQTTTTTTTGKATKEVQVEHGEVVTVAGNDLVVKMEDGTIRDFPDISESARIDVNGKQLGIHDLKPGMKLQRTTITTTTPKIITTVQTVTGKVWHVSPPNSVILTLENGQNQSFKIPKDQKFNVNGKMVDAFPNAATSRRCHSDRRRRNRHRAAKCSSDGAHNSARNTRCSRGNTPNKQ